MMSNETEPPSGGRRRPGADATSLRASTLAVENAFADRAAPAEPTASTFAARSWGANTTPGITTLPAVASRVLVIGYGNSLFADDGVGPLIAQQVADWCVPGVLALERHELVPELAADLAAAREVIFVDAALGGERVALTPVRRDCAADSSGLDHALTPPALLALAAAAFGRAPAAWLLTIPGADFSLGGAVSETARCGAAEALQILRTRL